MAVRCKYNWHNTGHQVWYDSSTFETLKTTHPVQFYDDFLGYTAGLYVANESTQTKWKTVETKTGGTITAAVLNDDPMGILSLGIDNTDEAQQVVLYWGDQQSLDMNKGLIIEMRLAFHTLPTTGTETVNAVFGLGSATNATADSVATNAWFRVESAAQTALLYESDDGDTDDDDNAASITLAADTYNIFRIDCSQIPTVKFFVDGAHVGSTTMAALSAAEGKVQPYVGIQKAKSSANTGTGTIYLDYIKAWQDRS